MKHISKILLAVLILFCSSLRAEIPETDRNVESVSAYQQLTSYNAASVRIKGGCSGTLIGPKTVLTAAHCYQTGQSITVILRDGREFRGRVINHSRSIDAAVVELDTDEKLPFVLVSPNAPPGGAEVLVYGVATAAGAKKIARFRAKVRISSKGLLDLIGETSAIGGESGGGVFYNSKLVGVVIRTDAYHTGRGSWTGASPTAGLFSFLRRTKCDDCRKYYQRRNNDGPPNREQLLSPELVEELRAIREELDKLKAQLSQIEKQKGPQGEIGLTGPTGLTGGEGRGITSVSVDSKGALIVVYTDGQVVNVGQVKGEKGEPGLAKTITIFFQDSAGRELTLPVVIPPDKNIVRVPIERFIRSGQ